MTIGELYEELKARKARSAFGRGVTEYALEMLEPVMSGDYDGITWDSACDVLDAGHLLNHVGGDGILACASHITPRPIATMMQQMYMGPRKQKARKTKAIHDRMIL
jgi:hypothetical protein